ncbi:glycosyltransferase family 2 protein [Paraferrimonas sp. SM1919]|uniref:glycosyltransferase n=1 Tax=Paraferrimonas sp. SM1919 TaxID=2662263 RepID=UPI0013D3385F|nr:glycosyltransferase family 2 protein [Paraferrimonas sp. SM1919]
MFSTLSSKLGLLTLGYGLTAWIIYLALFTVPVDSGQLVLSRTLITLLLLPILIKYLIQLLALPCYAWIERRRLKYGNLATDTLVSVLLPAYNEEVGIIATLESILASDYQHFEVIVINDGSTDSTHSKLINFIGSRQMFGMNDNIKYLSIDNGGKANALNQGLKLAKGDIIMTIDADCLMTATTISNTLKRFTSAKVGAVAGNIVIANQYKAIEFIQQLEYLFGFTLRRSDSTFNALMVIGGAAASYRKQVLEEVGAFNQDIVTEDIEMSTRILAAGYKTRFAADAITYTEAPSTWRSFCEQRLRWKYGRLQTFQKFKSLFFSRQGHHNKYLTWLILPVAIYAELVLLFEFLIISLAIGHCSIYQDFWPMLLLISFLAVITMVKIFFISNQKQHKKLVLLAPLSWLIFYIVDAIEWQALYRSLKRLRNNNQLKWQKWHRQGIQIEGDS